MPVVVRILQSDFALARSCRASTKMRSQLGALTSCGGLGRDLPGAVAEERERWQHLRVGRRGQDQQLRHQTS